MCSVCDIILLCESCYKGEVCYKGKQLLKLFLYVLAEGSNHDYTFSRRKTGTLFQQMSHTGISFREKTEQRLNKERIYEANHYKDR